MMAKFGWVGYCSLALLAVVPGAVSGQTPPTEAVRLEFFEKKVRPVLVNNCYNCHSANTNSKGGLRVDDRNGLVVGGGRGPAIVPGNPEKSLLIRAVHQTDKKLQMPPKKQLTAAEIADLAQWIKDGAAWPKAKVPTSIGKYNKEYDRLRKEHWAWQPLREAKVPAVKDAQWARDNLDRFLLAGLEQKGLKPVADADRVTLIRRVTFDLTGLPPTLADIDAFLQDKDATAFEKVVDRL